MKIFGHIWEWDGTLACDGSLQHNVFNIKGSWSGWIVSIERNARHVHKTLGAASSTTDGVWKNHGSRLIKGMSYILIAVPT